MCFLNTACLLPVSSNIDIVLWPLVYCPSVQLNVSCPLPFCNLCRLYNTTYFTKGRTGVEAGIPKQNQIDVELGIKECFSELSMNVIR